MEPVKGSFPEQKTTSTPSTLLPSRHFWSSMLNIRVVCNHMITGIKHNWKTLKTHTSLATFQIQWSFIAIEANDFHICRLTRDLSVASWYKPKPAKHWVASSTCFRGGRRIQKKNAEQQTATNDVRQKLNGDFLARFVCLMGAMLCKLGNEPIAVQTRWFTVVSSILLRRWRWFSKKWHFPPKKTSRNSSFNLKETKS